MSASEPVMDAVEKVARIVRDFMQPEGFEIAESDRILAERLMAAFPQLALEGRKEWGVHQDGEKGPRRFESRDRAVDVLARTSGDTDENGYRFNDRLVIRTAYYGEWSEVQS